jgi:hypothetical protein
MKKKCGALFITLPVLMNLIYRLSVVILVLLILHVATGTAPVRWQCE